MKKLKFTLLRSELSFSEKQKMYIDYHIGLQKNWSNFKDLISIELLEIGDNHFIVKVEDTDLKWRWSFSRMLCKKADLKDLRSLTTNDAFLFDIKDL